MQRFVIVAFLSVGACAPANYYYNFDLTDPGARNLTKPGERDTLEDADIRAEILVDPTSFQAILLDLTNKTDQALRVAWDQIAIVGPDGVAAPIRPDSGLGWIDPGTKIVARLVTFALPGQGSAAAGYEGSHFDLVVPMVVRGQPREYRYHMIAHVQKI